HGRVGIAGRGLLASVRQKRPLDPDFDLALEVPENDIAALAPLVPKLADLPGRLHGKGALKGNRAAPSLGLGLEWDQYATIDGKQGRIGVAIAADKRRAEAKVDIGSTDERRAIAIDAALPIEAPGGGF